MKKHKGFTLIELIVVIAIIATMTTMLLSAFMGVREKYKDVDTSELDRLESEYSFTYYDDLTLPTPVDYKEVLAEYGIDVSNLTDEQIEDMVEKLTKGK